MYRKLSISLLFVVVTILNIHAQCKLSYSIESHDNGSSNGIIHISVSSHSLASRIIVYHSVNPDPSKIVFTTTSDGEALNHTITGLSSGTYLITWDDSVILCVDRPEIYREGCTDPEAVNYDPNAVINGGCEYVTEVCPRIRVISSTSPECDLNNGVIRIDALGTSLRYSLDGGPYSPNSFFTGLSEGTYQITVKNTVLNCTDTENYSLSCGNGSSGGDVCPEITDVRIGSHPSNCSSNDGYFFIQATGSNNEYSSNGGLTWRTGPVFSGQVAGTYSVKVRNASLLCESSDEVTLLCSPTCNDGVKNGGETQVDCGGPCPSCCPENLSISVEHHPYCNEENVGIFTIQASGKDLEYSIDNGRTYQSSPTWTDRFANRTYQIAVRSQATNCIEKISFYLDCAQTCPVIESIDVLEPDCEVVNSGTLTINLGAGQGNNGQNGNNNPIYEYSIDGGNTWQERNVFSINGGPHTIIVRNNENNCSTGVTELIECHGCNDGVKNGNETDIDCGGDCHTCDCPTVEEIKTSAAQSDSGGKEPKVFICDLPENYNCTTCISYRTCHDDQDNDDDGLCDCADPDCATWFSEQCVKTKEQCADGLDNDGDGLIDCSDPQCETTFECQSFGNNKTTDDDLAIRVKFFIEQHDNLRSFVTNFGIPLWDKTLKLGPPSSEYPKAVPVRKYTSEDLTGMFIIENRDSILYEFYSRVDIDALSGKATKDPRHQDINLEVSDFDKIRLVSLFVELQRNLGGFIDPEHLEFLLNASQEPKESLARMPGCDYYERCVLLHSCTKEVGGCPATPIVENIPNRLYCWLALDCPNADRDLYGRTSFITFVPSGGTSGTRNTGSDDFNSRIESCDSGGGVGDPPRDGGEATGSDSFCSAITRINNECDPYGLGGPINRQTLEIISNKPDNNIEDPLLDDAGQLTEVADYICEKGPSDRTTAVVEGYADYVISVGYENADDFDKEDQISTIYSVNSFCFSQIGDGWTAVTTDIKFEWRVIGLPIPSRTINATITVVIPKTRFNNPTDVVSAFEAQLAATNALNFAHDLVFDTITKAKSWNKIGQRDVENEVAELMEFLLFAQFGWAKVSGGQRELDVFVCKAKVL